MGGLLINPAAIVFQHTAARRRLEIAKGIKDKSLDVSTHSRPKAAGRVSATSLSKMRFQHTAARRRLVFTASIRLAFSWFQHTAARRRLAEHLGMRQNGQACFNTQPPEGGWPNILACDKMGKPVSTHSRPKAAGYGSTKRTPLGGCFNTQPPEGGWFTSLSDAMCICLFQHTAARRRLAGIHGRIRGIHGVSTHSRPKAAGV